MAQRGHELATELYIMNQMYSNSERPNNNANAVRRNTDDRWIEWFLVVPQSVAGPTTDWCWYVRNILLGLPGTSKSSSSLSIAGYAFDYLSSCHDFVQLCNHLNFLFGGVLIGRNSIYVTNINVTFQSQLFLCSCGHIRPQDL